MHPIFTICKYTLLICFLTVLSCKPTKTITDFPHYVRPVLEPHTRQTVDERPCIYTTEKVDGYLWKLASKITMRPNQATGQWESTFKTYYDYDSLGNEILNESYSRDKSTGAWQCKGRQVYAYHAPGQISEMIIYKGSGTQWTASTKNVYEYTEDGGKIEKSYKYDNGVWSLLSKEEWTRSNNLVKINLFLIVDGQLKEETRYVSHLDHNGRDSVQIKYKEDKGGKWVESLKFLYEFEGEQLLKRIQLRRESPGNSWYVAEEQWRKYDALDRQTASYFMSDYINSGLTVKHYSDGHYDDSNGTAVIGRFDWDNNLNDWFMKSKNEVIYDCSVRKRNIMLPLSLEAGPNDLKQEVDISYEKAEADQWVPTSVRVWKYIKPTESVVIDPNVD